MCSLFVLNNKYSAFRPVHVVLLWLGYCRELVLHFVYLSSCKGYVVSLLIISSCFSSLYHQHSSIHANPANSIPLIMYLLFLKFLCLYNHDRSESCLKKQQADLDGILYMLTIISVDSVAGVNQPRAELSYTTRNTIFQHLYCFVIKSYASSRIAAQYLWKFSW